MSFKSFSQAHDGYSKNKPADTAKAAPAVASPTAGPAKPQEAGPPSQKS